MAITKTSIRPQKASPQKDFKEVIDGKLVMERVSKKGKAIAPSTLNFGNPKIHQSCSQRHGIWLFSLTIRRDAIPMNSDFKDLLNRLNEEGARYIVVGGYAVMKHTEPRYTKDVDVWVSPDRENAEKVFSALKNFGAPLAEVTVDTFTNKDLVYHMGREPNRIDIIMDVDGLTFDEAWGNSVKSNYGDVKTQFLSIEDLITNKKAVGRPQDLIDVKNLELALKQQQEKTEESDLDLDMD